MLEGDDLDWEHWEPTWLFEERINHPRYARIREADKYQWRGEAPRAQQIYAQECKHCDKATFEVCATAHKAESHRAQGEWEKAIEDYRRAAECFRLNDQFHNVAVAYLMLGLCYQAIAKYREAAEQFTRAHAQLDALRHRHCEMGNRRRAGHYKAMCETALLFQAHVNALDRAIQVVTPHPAEARPTRINPPPRIWESVVEFIPIFEQSLAAGSGVWLDAADHLEGYLQIGAFKIADKPYHLVNLMNDSNYLRLKRDSQYGCVCVKGDSMNQRGIEPEDYIIIERLREFQSGDLVAVALENDAGRYGLVKQIKIERDPMGTIQVVQLIPRSNNPLHKTLTYDLRRGDRLPDWIGQVIAVLKPVT